MPLELHPDAARNFDEKGAELVSQIVDEPIAGDSGGAFQQDRYVSGHIDESDLVPDSFAYFERRTPLGVADGVTIVRNNQAVTLPASAHKALDRLADGMSRTRALRDVIRRQELGKIILEWVWLSRWSSDPPGLVDHVLREAASKVAEVVVWLPIHGLAIEKDFQLGGVELRTISRQMLDAYCDRITKAVSPDQLAAAQHMTQRLRARFQGTAAAVVTVSAEASRAVEVAVARSIGALTILRFASPAALLPQARSYLTLVGGENVGKRTFFTTAGGQIEGFSEEIDEDYTQLHQALSRSAIDRLLQELQYFDRLYSLEEPNEFQEVARSVLEIFGRGTLYRSVSEKLIHIIVGLESLLLRNESEPIQDNLGWRIAYAHQVSPEERLANLSVVRAAYGLRSKFLHHGVTVSPEPDDMELLTKFMKIAWTFLFEVPRFAFAFDSRVRFLDMLDRRRAGG